uniref:Uncharacterized protein n=1 Tax=Latimeria chalumnae TaxID=7897 RepID=H3A1R8_LATCH
MGALTTVIEWTAPIVPVIKPANSIRICGDYKLTMNKATNLDTYLVLKVDDLYAKLALAKSYTKQDMNHAYQQKQLDEDSRQYATISKHKGLYQYTQLPFGISSACVIFPVYRGELITGDQ